MRKKKEIKSKEAVIIEDENVRNAILDYLQNFSLDLRMKYGVLDAKIEENPVRLILMAINKFDMPETNHNGIEIPIETKIIKKEEISPELYEKNKNLEAWKNRSAVKTDQQVENTTSIKNNDDFTEEEKKMCNIINVVGTNVLKDIDKETKDKNFKAWQDRHSKIKAVKE